MQLDFLPSPGFIPSGHRLRAELTKAISYVETVASLKGGKTEQAKSLDTFLTACKTAIASAIDTVAPTFASAEILVSAPNQLRVKFSEGLDPNYKPAGTAFVSSPAKTFSSVVIVGDTVVLTASTPFAAGVTTIAYTQPGTDPTRLRDTSGNLVATFTAQAVTNGVV